MSSIDASHIDFLVKMIETCSARGAFKADELKDVGTVYQVLKSTLEGAQSDTTAPVPPPPALGSEEFVPSE